MTLRLVSEKPIEDSGAPGLGAPTSCRRAPRLGEAWDYFAHSASAARTFAAEGLSMAS